MRLEEVFFAVRNNIGTYTGTSCPLSDFFSSFKKGSNSVRRVFERERCKKINICNGTSVTTFFRLLGEPILDEQQLKKIKLSYKHREFLFKFTIIHQLLTLESFILLKTILAAALFVQQTKNHFLLMRALCTNSMSANLQKIFQGK